MRRALGWFVGLVALTTVVFLLGPRTPVDTTINFDPAAIGADPDAYLAAGEAKIAGIRPDQQKQIIWANATKAKTPIGIVYVHGFSASSGEVRPLPDRVAASLKVNLFFTRLTGHGQDSAAMADGSVNAWLNDYAEAMAIGRRLGDKVFVIATSTGASLATVEASDSKVSKDIAGIVMISPNFGVQAGGSFLLTMPWGKQLAELMIGKERSFELRNERQRALWTWRYPTVALLPMAELVKLAANAPVERITIPALFIIADGDKVVRPDVTRTIAARWGAPQQLNVQTGAEDPDQHVIAGDALSPGTTEAMANRISQWIRETAEH